MFFSLTPKEIQRTFCSYKALMIGVNLNGRSLPQGEMQTELQAANQKWARACAVLDSWENRLHLELLRCQVDRHNTHTHVI